MATPTPAEVIAKRIVAEQDRHVKALSGRLKSEMQTEGAKHLTREEFIALVHRNWDDRRPIYGDGPNKLPFREAVLKQFGPKGFDKIQEDMVKAHGDPMMRGPNGVGGGELLGGTGTGPLAGVPGGATGVGNYGPPAAPVNGIPLPPYIPQPPTKWGG